MRVRGSCPICRTDRLLPGPVTAGNSICRDCAGITRDFFCDRCGFEGLLLGGRLCERCTLADTLTRRLDDGSGHVAPPLQPLITSLLETDRPKSRLIWLRNPNVVRLLRGLATGTIPLTHEGLHHEAPWPTVAHLRDLLMDSGVLPRIDRQLLLYQRWPTERVATIEDPEHHRLLRHFATWHQMRRLRTTAEKGPLGRSRTHQAKQEATQAGAFHIWLADRGRTIEHCRQADLDAWHTEKLAARRPAQTFLRWCMKTGRMPGLTLHPRSSPRTRRHCTSTADSPCSGGSSTTTPCLCGAASLPHSFSSVPSPSAASFASPSTTSPSSPSAWEIHRLPSRNPSPN
ncbi:hypothetical protein ACFV8T_30810 [Streptomyces sp. NPDC059832]|uniref:hypothetical protein n=1 Tax=Streptomyces sp. NPDC059832 TaxID=3346966 RepID=UPI0036566309